MALRNQFMQAELEKKAEELGKQQKKEQKSCEKEEREVLQAQRRYLAADAKLQKAVAKDDPYLGTLDNMLVEHPVQDTMLRHFLILDNP
jgi:signal transduction protein with GAF and PtsI domain